MVRLAAKKACRCEHVIPVPLSFDAASSPNADNYNTLHHPHLFNSPTAGNAETPSRASHARSSRRAHPNAGVGEVEWPVPRRLR